MLRGQIKNKTYTKLEREKGKLRMAGGSWTINLDDVPLGEVDKIVYITESRRYEITREKAIEKGFEQKFKGESKLVVPERWWS